MPTTIDLTLKWNGHTHSPFCHHGSSAPITDYLENAVAADFTRYSITEHPPLPDGWLRNEALQSTLAMPMANLDAYFRTMHSAKRAYQAKLDIRVGLELDYLPGSEAFTESLLRTHRESLDDLVLSVHFLPGTAGMRCIDYTPADFSDGLIAHYGSMEQVVDVYYQHVRQAILFAATLPVPVRIGHINLIHKFQTQLPPCPEDLTDAHLREILPLLKEHRVGIDVNTAGFRVETCQRPYVPSWFLRACVQDGIACVFGSDAHHPKDVAAGWDWFAQAMVDASNADAS